MSASGCSLTDAVVSCSVGDLPGGARARSETSWCAPPRPTLRCRTPRRRRARRLTPMLRITPGQPPPRCARRHPRRRLMAAQGRRLAMQAARWARGPPLAPSSPLAPPTPVLPSGPAALVAISDHSISPRRFAAAASGASAVAAQRNRNRGKPRRAGARVSYRLNMAARCALRSPTARAAAGRTAARAPLCGADPHNRSAPACRRTVTLAASFILSGQTRQNSFTFTGRLGSRKLRAGSCTLTATPPPTKRPANRQRELTIKGFPAAPGSDRPSGGSSRLHLVLKNLSNPAITPCVSADGYRHETWASSSDGKDRVHQRP